MNSVKAINRWASIKEALKGSKPLVRGRTAYVVADARERLRDVPSDSIDCVITSPPYGPIKDYGSKSQLGFGQNAIDEYLPDLTKVLAELYRVAKPGASMWLILDNIKINGRGIPLPWEAANRAREVGWIFHDLVVWDKGRSLPWSHKGKFRGICEYIVLLGKGSLKTFKLDAARESDHLSWYWVKYPERYHPDGKAPSDLWHFPTPLQGSWSTGVKQPRHFCPFPIELVARILSISTEKNDVVLDPFAGTGSVIATADFLGRHGLGIDLSKEFGKQYYATGYDSYIEQAEKRISVERSNSRSLRETIINLRMLKYPKILFAQLVRLDRADPEGARRIKLLMVMRQGRINIRNGNIDTLDLGRIRVKLFLDRHATNKDGKLLGDEIEKMISVPPLSKFGLRVDVDVVKYNAYRDSSYWAQFGKRPLFLYRNGAFYSYSDKISLKNIRSYLLDEANQKEARVPAIVSNVGLNVSLPIED